MSFAMTDRCALGVLALLKLGKDFSDVKQADVTKPQNVLASISEVFRCRTCAETIENGSCFNQCPPTSDGDIFAIGCLADQITALLKGATVLFWDSARYRESNQITDCTDGSRHREFLEKVAPTVGGCKVITLMANMDGAQLFESSSKSIWPIILVVNELPKEIRFQMQHMLIYAIWEGQKGETQDVPFTSMLAQLGADLRKINNSDFTIEVNGVKERIKVFVTRMAGDSPAKAEMLNMKYHNGFFGCGVCEAPGYTTAKGGGTNHSYAPTGETFRRRTAKRMVHQTTKQSGSAKAKGMKGIPPVNALPNFSSAEDMVLDDLHFIYIGVGKKIPKIFFGGKKKGDKLPCQLGKNQIEQILTRLRGIKPPPQINRFPRTFTFSDWKAADYRVWMLLFSLPCCIGIVKEEYLEHWALLVESVVLLSQSEISVSRDMPRAEALLKKFCDGFAGLYGENNYGINVHSLEHVTEYVDLHGPLPVNSLFPFEGLNGQIIRHSHGTNIVRKTILRQMMTYQSLRRKMTVVSDPEENRYIARLKRHRIGIPTTGTGWRTYGRPFNQDLEFPPGAHSTCPGKTYDGVDESLYQGRNWQDPNLANISLFETSHVSDRSNSKIVDTLESEDTSQEIVECSNHGQLKLKVEELQASLQAEKDARKVFEEAMLKRLTECESDQAEKDNKLASLKKILDSIKGSRQDTFTLKAIGEDTAQEVVAKYRTAGLNNWRKVAGTFLVENFTAHELATQCPTEAGSKQSKLMKEPLNPARIDKLRRVVMLFVKEIGGAPPSQSDITSKISDFCKHRANGVKTKSNVTAVSADEENVHAQPSPSKRLRVREQRASTPLASLTNESGFQAIHYPNQPSHLENAEVAAASTSSSINFGSPLSSVLDVLNN
ncbi:hypothetical protein BV898_19307 [Hypsibius exemplaris]|uniref:BEN domain-containing protein n=1 Tax=Hypsibius exemplaris TaxID=2072580 RepID=A0A9X6NJB7_HYPEX|nr:hypothetical protein BV898_19307 [Hypsibius exemplaris]